MLKLGAIAYQTTAFNMSLSKTIETFGDTGATFTHNDTIGRFTCEKGVLSEWYIKEDEKWHPADFIDPSNGYQLQII